VTDPTAPQYHLISPDAYTGEHRCFLEVVKESIDVVAAQTSLILGAKDIHSRLIISSQVHSAEAARFANEPGANPIVCDEEEDQALLRQPDINKKLSVLSIDPCRSGCNALVFEIQLLKHHPSHSILGTIFNAREIEIPNFFSFIPSCVLEFGTNCRIENSQGASAIGTVRLSDYEHEVCYLLTMNWSCKQIAEFLNTYRPKSVPRGVDTIYKCRNRICDKLGLVEYSTAGLREHLISLGMHKKMPQSFFKHILGSKLIDPKAFGF
jgi:hypothetical protein